MSHNEHSSMDRTAAKKYFKGAGLIPGILIVLGLLLALIKGPFILLSLCGIGWILVVKFSADAYEREVDEIIAKEREFLLERASAKLNVLKQQTELIEPISIIGASYQPDLVSDGKVGGFFKKISKQTTKAPILVRKVGKDGDVKSSLIVVTTFLFGETELYIYFANLDLTTGLIFHEGTHEYFYKDICGVTTDQKLESVFNLKKKKFEYKFFEFIDIYTYGCNHKAAFDASASGTTLDKQFMAMRNLIRDKKDE